MVMASAAAGQITNEGIEKSKTDASQQAIDSGLHPGGRQAKRLQQADLSGFIGADVWMVGKYER
jgi:hypothetical protein